MELPTSPYRTATKIDAEVNMNTSQPLSTDGREISQLPEIGLSRRPYNAPALYTPGQRPVATHGRNGHQPPNRGRSMSHSLPSIPHGNNNDRGHHTAMEYGSGDGNNRVMFSALTPQSPLTQRASKSAKAQDRDLMTGKCMTCDSMVRWPRGLAVFRCSVCVTINDLTPVGTIQDAANDHRRHNMREYASSQNLPLLRGRQAHSHGKDQIHYI